MRVEFTPRPVLPPVILLLTLPPTYMSTVASHPARFRSKTVTAALAFFSARSARIASICTACATCSAGRTIVGTLIGVPGFLLLMATERTSTTGWLLAFPGAVSLLAAFLAAIVYGLRPDEKWDAQFNARTGRHSESGWTVIFIVIFSLLIGAFLLMTGLAVSFQTYFESQIEAAKSLSQ